MKESNAASVIRTRRFLVVLGVAFFLISAFVALYPEDSPDHAALICGAIGFTFVVFGMFASGRVVTLLADMVTGWF